MSTTTITRATELVARFEAVNASLIALVTNCGDEHWRQPCVDDARSVAVVAHHAAEVQQGFTGMVQTLAAGKTYTPRASMEEIHRENAQHADDHAPVEKQTILDLLWTSSATIVPLLRSLDDAALDRTAGLFGGQPLSVGQVMELVVIGHAAEHLATLQATLPGSSTAQ